MVDCANLSYYHRNKELMLINAKKYYEKNKDKINQHKKDKYNSSPIEKQKKKIIN